MNSVCSDAGQLTAESRRMPRTAATRRRSIAASSASTGSGFITRAVSRSSSTVAIFLDQALAERLVQHLRVGLLATLRFGRAACCVDLAAELQVMRVAPGVDLAGLQRGLDPAARLGVVAAVAEAALVAERLD